MPVSITDATTEFVTLDEVKRHLNIDPADPAGMAEDAEIDLMRSAAQDIVESLVGPVLHRTVTQTVPATQGCMVLLNTLPVLSVTSVTAAGATLTGYTLDANVGALSGLYAYVPATVTYQAGRDSCPDAIRVATLLTVGELWRSQLGNSPSALPDAEMSDYQQAVSGGSAIPPPRAMALLAPYILLPGVA